MKIFFFHTKDNVLIRGWFIPNANPHAKTIILLHGYPADKGDILSSRIFLHKNYHLLFLDFRYLGESEGWYSTVGKNEVLDLLGAIDFLKTRGIKEVGVWGLSLGGAVALMAAEHTTAIKAVVAESSYARLDWMAYDYYRIPYLRYPLAQLTRLWGWIFLGYDIKDVAPEQTVKHLSIPILLIHGKNDNVVLFAHAERLQQALAHNPKLSINFADDLSHGASIQNYQIIITDFFAKYL